MSSYGYTPPRFGTYTPLQRPLAYAAAAPSPIASALAAPSPLANRVGGPTNVPVGPQPFTAPRPLQAPLPPQTIGAPVTPGGTVVNTAPTPGAYDLNTDPVLQQITALTGMGDQQANSAALKQRQQLLLGYGDKGLAEAVLGAGDPTALAAEQNPTSIVAQLAQQRGRNETNLNEALNQANLFYSGDRITQEQQAAQDYEAQRAAAAGQVSGGLDTIQGNLAAALAGNQQQRTQGMSDAYNRQLQEILAGLLQGGGPAGYGPNGTPYNQLTPADNITAGGPGVASPGFPGSAAPPPNLAAIVASLYPTAGGGPTRRV